MCNSSPDIMDKLSKTVCQFLSEGRAFTGYDVTIETRTREDIQLRHRDCRQDIHEIQELRDAVNFGYDAGGAIVQWMQSSRPHPQTGQAVFIYHPDTFDADDFVWQGAQQTPSTPPNVTPVAATVSVPSNTVDDSTDNSDSGGKQSDGSFMTDYRRRLFIETSFVRDMGLSAQNDVYVLNDQANNKIVLSASEIAGLDQISKQVVERNGDLRLSARTLQSADLDPVKPFNVEAATRNGEKVVEISQVS